jgi:uncharacterized protein (TIGR00369 family)
MVDAGRGAAFKQAGPEGIMSDKQQGGLASREVAAAESGLDFLQGLIEGRHPAPPFALTFKMRLVAISAGRAVFQGEPDPSFFNPLGTIHGGWTSGIMDSAMACAVHSTCKPGETYTTVELKVNLVRAVLPSAGLLTCEGRIIHRGGTIATSEGFLRDDAGRLYAHGTETCMILDVNRARRG